ncbi:pyroglutamyl-peptidase I [Paenibacillus sp. GP183]|uniref:pyroglutamyl-peptidase I n=1 Tax=Paenibacillus sp. GP183 TaxID=1882751 RepID=UPI0008985CBC|nr:pyroglutamyl-peptidase I [Paenibacillus sp. GP183]SEC79942.1 pyroglutamyl-peptidase I Cysteine peptidase. MEROPS family C15 [Paenibacillus sp. GP183]
MQKVLITGFEPFGGEPVNPSLEAVKLLATKTFTNVEVITKKLPAVFHTSIRILRATMDEVKPDIVICVGQAGGRSDITVERVAINVDDAKIPDNEGNRPIDVSIIENGPAAYWSGLPIKAIVEKMREAGVPASVSQTAGTFVCNHTFYGLSHLIATEYPGIRGGFIHIPYLPEQAARHPGAPSMSLEMIVRSIEIAIQTATAQKDDIIAVGGEIS